jgi:hypothetical protein
MHGRKVERHGRQVGDGAIDVGHVLKTRLPDCDRAHSLGGEVRSDDADLGREDADVDVEVCDLLARYR